MHRHDGSEMGYVMAAATIPRNVIGIMGTIVSNSMPNIQTALSPSTRTWLETDTVQVLSLMFRSVGMMVAIAMSSI